MDANVINIGKAVRDGLRLNTIEVVALVHDVCLQLEVDGAKKLPSSIDELSINNAGSVVMPSGRPAPTLRIAVATLLDALIASVSDEAEPVPPALKSLPGRLREAGNAAKASDIRDLLSIFRWHLPQDPRHVLRELASRAELAGLPQATEPIDEFVDETSAAVPVRARKQRGPSYRLAYSAAVLALLAAAYIGSRYSYRTTAAPAVSEAPESPAAAPVESAPPAPRIVVRDQQSFGDAPRPLLLSVTGGAFSPSFEGRGRLLFHAGRNSTGRLFTASLDDTHRDAEVTPLLDDEGRSYHVRLSPDGQSLAFDSDRDGERAVYVADRDGSTIERVSGNGYAAVPSWSPDMTTLTFVRAEPGRPRVWNLWQRDLASGEMTRLTRFRSGQVWGASWFPDSMRYAFSHDDRLIIADRAGRETATFTSPIAGRLVRTPAVSPDGGRIIFQVFRDGAWLLDLESGQMRRILDDATAEEFAWHPDGRHVAYHSRRDGEWRIWVMPA